MLQNFNNSAEIIVDETRQKQEITVLGVSRYQGTDMSQSMSLNSQNNYEIKIYGQLDDSWLGWVGQAKALVEIVADNSQVTTFSDVVMDQTGLVGLIRRLHGLGIVLISIRQV
ncbi:MAG TPA: hypothetical protein VK249_31525 [Anaerolineales bacterium]|nr:hypothetical protein [Anaerolineales bacterium]